MFKLTNITKAFGAVEAIRNLDLVVEPGQTTVLIGPSGCGKSTILRLMIGLLRPDRGTVQFEDRMLTPKDIGQQRLLMGYVIQEGGLFPHMTARANVSLMSRQLGWPRPRLAERLAELARLTRLPEECLDRYPLHLSGGQRQRVSLMRALMLDPDVLLLDEPLGALDPIIRSDLQADLRDVYQSLGKTVVMVTHDMGEAAYFGGTIVLMKEGSIVQRGPLRELMEAPADPFVTRFISAQRSPLESLA